MEASQQEERGTSEATSPSSSADEVKAYESKFLKSDEELAALGVKPHELENFRREIYRNSFGINTWVKELEEFTFKTVALDLSTVEARVILKVKHSDAKDGTKDLSEEEAKVLNELSNRIQEALRIFPQGAFIKLDTRSPKDVSVDDYSDPGTRELLQKEFERLRGQGVLPTDGISEFTPELKNHIVAAFVKATNKRLRITSAAEAIHLLTASSRVMQDLSKSLEFEKYRWTTQLVLREWNDYIADHPEREFRAFVHGNQLNAITQYFSFIHFPELVDQKASILKQMVTFFEAQKHLIPHQNFVIDFFVFPDRVWIIELNPFHIGAGAGHFSWKTDRALFMNGPLDFRVTGTIPGDAYDYIPPRWRRYLEALLAPKALASSSCPCSCLKGSTPVILGASILMLAIALPLLWRYRQPK